MSYEVWDLKIRARINSDDPETLEAYEIFARGVDRLIERFVTVRREFGLNDLDLQRVPG